MKQSDAAMKVGTDAMLLGAFVNTEGKSAGLDIGTGTGVLALMLTQKKPELHFDGVELDTESAEECKLNFSNSDWSERLSVVQGDFAACKLTKSYDLIVSNPPFYQSTLLNNDARKANARHAQSLPMDILVGRVGECLSVSGDFWIIVPWEDEGRWSAACKTNGLHLNTCITIYGKENGEAKRVVLRYSWVENSVYRSDFTVRKENGGYTEEYRKLTMDFHEKSI
ncbi:MAG: methyltransferase [Crocinitomicaceae bacterium]|nr:methyltransferase [Crocinitomicaceae bacterium]